MNTAQKTKNFAKVVAKQIAQEPIEILKTAGSQVTGVESVPPLEPRPQETSEDQIRAVENQKKLQDEMKSGRRMEALKREIEDIHKQDLFKDLQRRISEGEEIPLEDYSEISIEEKQVLRAQMEAVKFQKQQAEYMESQGNKKLFGSAKKGRRFGQGQKAEAEKQQTHVEKPVPPSG